MDIYGLYLVNGVTRRQIRFVALSQHLQHRWQVRHGAGVIAPRNAVMRRNDAGGVGTKEGFWWCQQKMGPSHVYVMNNICSHV